MRLVEGSVPDIATLLNAVKTARALGLETPLIKMDRGCFSTSSLGTLAANQAQELIPVPANTALFKTAFARLGASGSALKINAALSLAAMGL